MENGTQNETEESGKRLKIIEGASQSADEYGSTMEALKQAGESVPVFTGSYDAQINDLFNSIINRKSFSYDPEYDPSYLSYRQRYERQGRSAMKDTVAQASALTGGYASSYAQTAGQQQYGAYLEKLGDVLPDLYSAAYERYKAEADTLNDNLNTASSLAQDEYGRYRDLLSDAKDAEQSDSDRFDKLYDLMLKTGYKPTAAEMAKSGMSAAQAEAIRREYYRANNLTYPDDRTYTASNGSGGSDYNYYANYDFSKLNSASASAGTASVSAEEQKLAANAKGASNTTKSRRY